MSIKVNAINHVSLVVKDKAAAEKFYIGVLGLRRHPKIASWLILNERDTLHLLNIPGAMVENSLYHKLQHFGLEVPDIREVAILLSRGGLKPFQMDFKGATNEINGEVDPLNFGTETIFVYDPDGNLVEFIQLGRGIFS